MGWLEGSLHCLRVRGRGFNSRSAFSFFFCVPFFFPISFCYVGTVCGDNRWLEAHTSKKNTDSKPRPKKRGRNYTRAKDTKVDTPRSRAPLPQRRCGRQHKKQENERNKTRPQQYAWYTRVQLLENYLNLGIRKAN